MIQDILRYIWAPWSENSLDIALTVLCITMVLCVFGGIYFGFKMERNGEINEKLNFYSFSLVFSFLAVEIIFYWYIAIAGVVCITFIAKSLMRDEAKERYYAATQGMTYKELKEIWYESEERYAEVMDMIEKMTVDKATLAPYSFSNNCIKRSLVIATVIFAALVILVGEYRMFP